MEDNDVFYKSSSDNYDVSVCIITYNKSEFIRETIDSVLMQETSCKYEIVVGDNCSTDGTREILTEYWKKHSDRFSLIYNAFNKELCGNMYSTLSHAKGKYSIILYGDDYWISPHKMQIEYDFLESHNEYIGVSTAIEIRYSGEKETLGIVPRLKACNRKETLEDFSNCRNFPMAGLMFRNGVFFQNREHFEKMTKASKYIDDLSFCFLILMLGDIYIIGEPTAVYRNFRKGSGASNFNSVNSSYQVARKSIELLNNLDRLTDNKLKLEIRYGGFLYRALRQFICGDLTKEEYQELKNMVGPKYWETRFSLIGSYVFKRLVYKIFY